MDSFRSFVAFSKQVYRGEKAPEWPLLQYLQPFANRSLVWFNISDWKRASTLARVSHALVGFLLILYWSSVAVELTQEGVSWDNVVDFCQSFSLTCGGSIAITKFIQCWRQRKRLSILLETIAKKVELSHRDASQERKTEANNQFLLLSWATFAAIASGFVLSAPIFVYIVYTGERYIKLAFPAALGAVTTYGFLWWIECCCCLVIFMYSSLYYTTMDAMLMDAILQVGWLFRVQYDKLENLNPTDGELNRKFGRIVAELVELKGLTEEYVDIIWYQQFAFWSSIYIALGLSSLCLLLVLDKGIVEILSLLFYPSYLLLLMTAWSTGGNYFTEKTSELNSKLFNSKWPDMPPSSRKMVAILMIFGQKTPTIDIAPFYEQNFVAFAQVLNKTYRLIALVRNFIGDV